MSLTSYRISANLFTPADDPVAGEGDRPFEACSISLDIFDRERKSAYEQLMREFTEPGPPGWPVVLGDAYEFLRGLCESFLDRGYLLRVDLPARSGVEAPDTPFDRAEDLDELLSRLSVARRNGYLYPIKIWGLERANVKPAMEAIDSYGAVRFDQALAERIIDLGCFRLELAPEYMALWFQCAKTREMRTLVDALAGRLNAQLDWKVGRET
jgi:hypothetical protein